MGRLLREMRGDALFSKRTPISLKKSPRATAAAAAPGKDDPSTPPRTWESDRRQPGVGQRQRRGRRVLHAQRRRAVHVVHHRPPGLCRRRWSEGACRRLLASNPCLVAGVRGAEVTKTGLEVLQRADVCLLRGVGAPPGGVEPLRGPDGRDRGGVVAPSALLLPPRVFGGRQRLWRRIRKGSGRSSSVVETLRSAAAPEAL